MSSSFCKVRLSSLLRMWELGDPSGAQPRKCIVLAVHASLELPGAALGCVRGSPPPSLIFCSSRRNSEMSAVCSSTLGSMSPTFISTFWTWLEMQSILLFKPSVMSLSSSLFAKSFIILLIMASSVDMFNGSSDILL